MADVTKKVDRNVPVSERAVYFDQTDGGTGDVLMIKDSLGKAASRVLIEAAATLQVRLNVYHTIFPMRETNDGFPGEKNVSLGQQIKDNTGATFTIAADESLEFDKDIPVSDIEIISAAGSFTISCM